MEIIYPNLQNQIIWTLEIYFGTIWIKYGCPQFPKCLSDHKEGVRQSYGRQLLRIFRINPSKHSLIGSSLILFSTDR